MAAIVLHRVGFTSTHSRLFQTSAVCHRYKKKWVEMGRKKVKPRELALSYFDTYYPKVYGEKCWEQTREAVLTKKKKYCALMNNFAEAQKSVNDMMADQQAYDMFALTGNKLEVPYELPTEISPAADYTEDSRMISEWTVDLSDSLADNEPIEYEETAEGFMVPKVKERDEIRKPYYAPDLYDYVPAVRRITSKEELEQDMSRQMLMLDTDPDIEIVAADGLMLPPMLKCHIHPIGQSQMFYSPRIDETKLLTYYILDAASVLPVIALELRPNDRVLDLCAAPGGKSLAIAQCLIADEIVCVDSSRPRLNRLRDTFRWYIPGSMDGENDVNGMSIAVIEDDARLIGDKHSCRYDKVLVDVPCNTDRKSLQEDENNRFKRTRVTERLRLPQVQEELLISGIKACRPGGVVVYSTCTLTVGQNDHVVEAAVRRLTETRPDIKVVVQDTSPIVDRLGHLFRFWPGCRYGQLVLPAAEANFGPMYFAKLLRVQ